jgi:hypothetical protein
VHPFVDAPCFLCCTFIASNDAVIAKTAQLSNKKVVTGFLFNLWVAAPIQGGQSHYKWKGSLGISC